MVGGASVADVMKSDGNGWFKELDLTQPVPVLGTVDRARGVFTFKGFEDYEIDLDEIRTEKILLKWVLHLCGKTWISGEMLGEFIEEVAEFKGFDVRGL